MSSQSTPQATLQPHAQPKTQPQSSQQPLLPLSQCQPIEVLTTTHGTPERVRWEGVEYICGDIPLDWIWHQAWWRAEVPIDGEIDIVAWRLRLLPLPGQRVTRERCIDAVLRRDATWVLLEEIT